MVADGILRLLLEMNPASPPPTQTPAPVRFEDTAVAFAQRSTGELRQARWMFGLIGAPWLVRLGSRVISGAVALRLPIAWALRPVFDYFCGGETIVDSRGTAQRLFEGGVRTILDYSAEGQTGDAALEASKEEILPPSAKPKATTGSPLPSSK